MKLSHCTVEKPRPHGGATTAVSALSQDLLWRCLHTTSAPRGWVIPTFKSFQMRTQMLWKWDKPFYPSWIPASWNPWTQCMARLCHKPVGWFIFHYFLEFCPERENEITPMTDEDRSLKFYFMSRNTLPDMYDWRYVYLLSTWMASMVFLSALYSSSLNEGECVSQLPAYLSSQDILQLILSNGYWPFPRACCILCLFTMLNLYNIFIILKSPSWPL